MEKIKSNARKTSFYSSTSPKTSNSQHLFKKFELHELSSLILTLKNSMKSKQKEEKTHTKSLLKIYLIKKAYFSAIVEER